MKSSIWQILYMILCFINEIILKSIPEKTPVFHSETIVLNNYISANFAAALLIFGSAAVA